jgi:hypothetical protein
MSAAGVHTDFVFASDVVLAAFLDVDIGYLDPTAFLHLIIDDDSDDDHSDKMMMTIMLYRMG